MWYFVKTMTGVFLSATHRFILSLYSRHTLIPYIEDNAFLAGIESLN